MTGPIMILMIILKKPEAQCSLLLTFCQISLNFEVAAFNFVLKLSTVTGSSQLLVRMQANRDSAGRLLKLLGREKKSL